MRARIAAAALIAVLGAAAPAWAGDPIMPLSQVRAGMHCTALSVIQGTDITSFNADVLSVIPAVQPSDARILIRVSGPAVDVTGIGAGFSGSPIYCPDEQGTQRSIGAIAEGTNDYGNKVVLATPIEGILAEAVSPPAGRAARRSTPGRRELFSPLTVTGLAPALARALVAAGQRAGRPVIAVPSASSVPYAPPVMRPGSAVAASLASGDLAVGDIGTVAYTDGDAVWAFGHPIDGSGRRSLLLQDAYVYTVINNPNGADTLASYKLAAPGNDLGVFSNDGLDAAVGRVGTLPPRIPVRIEATDGDSGQRITTSSEVADETDVDLPNGQSGLALVAPVGVDQAAIEALHGAPARVSQSMCVRIHLRERKSALRFCNRYIFGGSDSGGANSTSGQAKRAQSTTNQGTMPAAPSDDVASALSMIDNVDFGRLHVTSVDVSMRLHRGLRQALILDASARTRVRLGQRVKVTLTTRIVRGRERRFSFRLRIPRSLRPGPAVVELTGTPSDGGGASSGQSVTAFLTALLKGAAGSAAGGGEQGPQSIDELADAVAGISRYDGVTANFFASARPTKHPKFEDVPVFRDPQYRVSGSGLLLFDVRR